MYYLLDIQITPVTAYSLSVKVSVFRVIKNNQTLITKSKYIHEISKITLILTTTIRYRKSSMLRNEEIKRCESHSPGSFASGRMDPGFELQYL